MVYRMTSALAGLLLLAGIATPSLAAERVIFMTDWKPEAEQGGFYEAAALGLYAKHGLDVQIRSGGAGANPQQLMAAGAVDMAIGSNSFFGLNLVKAGAPVVAVMASYQKDPEVLILHPEDPANNLADLKGRSIMISDASIDTMWEWLKGKYGFDDKQIRKYTGNPAPFIVDKQAIQQGYVTSEPLVIEQAGGFKPKLFLLADSGYSTYGSLVLAKSDWVVRKPEIVQAFVEASIEGWRAYLNGDSAPADALIKKGNPDMTDDILKYARDRMREYGIVESGDTKTMGIGAMTDARWGEFFKMASGQGLYPVDLDYKKAYTLQFVNKGFGLAASH
ncbi:MAG: putative transporter, periplasmic substrate-binding protein [Rhodospirillales bacterium]|nr:putative transporter, periplasmic substrate-binding protein [Rhodospirillales bacterium]